MSIADAYVELHVDGDSIDSEVVAKLRKSRRGDVEADRHGQRLGRSMAAGLGRTFGRNLGSFLAPAFSKSSFTDLTNFFTTGFAMMGKAAAPLSKGLGFTSLGIMAAAAVPQVLALAGSLGNLVGVVGLLPGLLAAPIAAIGTLVVGFKGVGEALKNMGDAEKFNQALEKLTPNARAFAVAVKSLGPQWGEFQDTIQENLFKGLGEEIKKISAVYLPLMSKGMGAVSVELQKGFTVFAAGLRSTQMVASLGGIFENVAAATKPFWEGLTQILLAITSIAKVGTSFFPGWATGFSSLATQFNNFIKSAEESGSLREFMQSGIDAVKDLGSVLIGVWDIFKGVIRAAEDAGGGTLATFGAALRAVGDVVNSPAFQKGLTSFFKSAMAGADALLSALPAVGGLLSVIGPLIGNLAVTVGQFLGPLISQLADGLAGAFTILGPPIRMLVAALVTGLGPIIRVLAAALPPLASALAPIITMLATSLAPVLANLAPAFQSVVNAVLGFFKAIQPLLDLLLPVLIPVLGFLAEVLLGAVAGAINGVTNLIEGLITFFQGVIDFVTAVFTGNWQGAWEAIKTIFSGVWQAIVGIVQVALNIGVLGIFRRGLAAIKAIWTGGWTAAKTVMEGIWNGIKGSLSGAWTWVVNLVTKGTSGFVSAITTGIGKALSFLSSVPDRIKSALGNTLGLLKDAGMNIIRGLISGITSMARQAIDVIKNTVSSMVDAAKEFLHISSPSKVMEQIGNWTGEGLSIGVDDSTGGVVQSAKTLAEVMTKSFQDNLRFAPPPLAPAVSGGPGIPASRTQPQRSAEAALASSIIENVNIDVTIPLEALKDVASLADLLEVLQKARTNGRKTLRSGVVTA